MPALRCWRNGGRPGYGACPLPLSSVQTGIEGPRQERGCRILLLTALPMMGFRLTTSAGASGVRLAALVFWVMVAKVIPTWLLVVIVVEIVGLFFAVSFARSPEAEQDATHTDATCGPRPPFVYNVGAGRSLH